MSEEVLISGDGSASSGIAKLDIGGMRAAALALVSGNTSTTASVAPATQLPGTDLPYSAVAGQLAAQGTSVTPVSDAVAAQAPLAPVQANPEATAADVMELPDDKYVKLTINGQTQVLLGREAKRQMISGASYTQQMQQLRATEKSLKDSLGVEPTPEMLQQVRGALMQAGQMEQLLLDPDALRNYFQKTFGANVAAMQQQAAALVAAQTSTLRQSLLESVQDAVRSGLDEVETTRQKTRLRMGMQNQIDTIANANPILKAIPNLYGTVKEQVRQMGPKSEADLQLAVTSVLQGIVEQARPFLANPAVAQRTALQSTGIQPPQGSHIAPEKVSLVGSDGKFSFGALRQAAKSYSSPR